MAIEEAINIKINADAGAKSLSELKKEFKETQKTLEGLTQGSKEYIATLQKLGGIKDDIGDLNTTIKAFNPEGKIQAFGTAIGGVASGFQAAQGAAALFGQEGEALQKTLLKVQAASALADGIKGVVGMGDAFKVLGAIVKANPIFLIIGVITAIGGALFALKDKVAFIGDAFEAVGEVIGYVIDKGKEFLDWIGVTSFALDDMRDSIISNNKKIQEANASRYDSEIADAKRAGKETEILEIKKLQDFTKTNDAIILQLRLRKQANGELSEEEQKQLDELVEANKTAYNEIRNVADKFQDDRVAKNKKANEELKTALDKEREESRQRALQARKDLEELEAMRERWHQEELKRLQEIKDKEFETSEKEIEDIYANQNARNELIALNNQNQYNGLLLNLQAERDLKLQNTELTESEILLIKKKYADEEDALKREQFEKSIAVTQQAVDATRAITDIAFGYALKQAQGNAKKEKEIKKKQFKLNKAFSVAQIILNTIMGITQALGNNPPPLSWVTAGINSAMGTAATIKALSTKFDGGGDDGGGGGANIGSLGGGSGGVALAPPITGSTQLNPDGTIKSQGTSKEPMVKAFVTETDITKSQKRVNTIEERSKL
jgi:hypothetical protein